jgi:N-acetylmuramoyl-L-alanine amidase
MFTSIKNGKGRNMKQLRVVNVISLHCDATDHPAHNDIAVIKKWHLLRSTNGVKWTDVGYHYFVQSGGIVQEGRPIYKDPAAVEGHNKGMIAICLHGLHVFTDVQFDSTAQLCAKLIKTYGIKIENIHGHNHWTDKKTCPNFDVKLVTDKISKYL